MWPIPPVCNMTLKINSELLAAFGGVGRDYWLGFAPNVWSSVVVKSSAIYIVVYLALARFYYGRGRNLV